MASRIQFTLAGLCIFVFIQSSGLCDGPQLIADISAPVIAVGSAGSFTSVNGVTLMAATSADHGMELWISDGTPEDTVMLADIYPGMEDSNPTSLTEMNGFCYFCAQDGVNGYELWKSNGTAEGTVLVRDIRPGPGSSSPSYLKVAGGILYFRADDGVHGQELWRSDGTSEGTWMVKDIKADGNGLHEPYFAEMGGHLYFCAIDALGAGLWKSDGSQDGTEKLMNGLCSYLTAAAGKVFFSCGGELYWSDGAAAGSGLLADINPSGSSYPKGFTIIDNLVIFSATDGFGTELWKADALTGSVTMVKDIYSGASSSWPENLANMNGMLYFKARGTDGVRNLWRSDGTAAGTVRISAASACVSPEYMTWFQSKVFFTASHSVYGHEVFSYNPTEDSLTVISDVMPNNPGPYSFSGYQLKQCNNMLFFRVQHSFSSDLTLYRYSGSSVLSLGAFWQTNNWGSQPYGFTEFNDMVYFGAQTSTEGFELWRTNCMDVTEIVKDIQIGSGDGLNRNRVLLYPVANFMLFEGLSSSGYSLWRTDGTAAGTVKVYDVDPIISMDPSGQKERDFIAYSGDIYFVGYDRNAGRSGLWKTDGTAAGTGEFCPLINSAELVQSGALLYFRNSDSTHGTELWKSDGTQAGTMMVKDLNPGSNSSNPYSFFPVQDKIVFNAWSPAGASGLNKLWVSDGTEAGTSILKDFIPAEAFTGWLISVYGDELYLMADDGIHATGLWKTDGTEAGTQKVKGIDAASFGIFYTETIVYDGILYFCCADTAHGAELWRTDGTETGTYILKEFVTGTEGITLKSLREINGLLFIDFEANGLSQQWVSDGTEGGTVMLTELSGLLIPGDYKTKPLYLDVIRETLIFGGGKDASDIEPMFYRIDKGDATMDGSIDLTDLRIMAENWLQNSSISNDWGQHSDITVYGKVDLTDLARLADGWGL